MTNRQTDLPSETELLQLERQLANAWGNPSVVEVADFATRALGRMLRAYRVVAKKPVFAQS